jgi:cytoskeletal protein RodZ
LQKAARQQVAEAKTQIGGVGGTRGETSLGQFLTEARKSGGYTPEQVAAETHIPAHYIRAIETDDYGLISDQLYLLPFVRRYAVFIGLDPEDVASRFVHDVQKAENTAAKTSEPIPMITMERKSGRGRFLILVIILIAGAVTGFLIVKKQALPLGLLHLSQRGSLKIEPLAAASPPSPGSATQVGVSAVPFDSRVTPAAASDDLSSNSPRAAFAVSFRELNTPAGRRAG